MTYLNTAHKNGNKSRLYRIVDDHFTTSLQQLRLNEN